MVPGMLLAVEQRLSCVPGLDDPVAGSWRVESALIVGWLRGGYAR